MVVVDKLSAKNLNKVFFLLQFVTMVGLGYRTSATTPVTTKRNWKLQWRNVDHSIQPEGISEYNCNSIFKDYKMNFTLIVHKGNSLYFIFCDFSKWPKQKFKDSVDNQRQVIGT